MAIALGQVLVHLRAGQWTEAHNLVQHEAPPLAAWLHGIPHIQEGDLEDAECWYGKADRHFRSRGTPAEELERFEAAMFDSMTGADAQGFDDLRPARLRSGPLPVAQAMH